MEQCSKRVQFEQLVTTTVDGAPRCTQVRCQLVEGKYTLNCLSYKEFSRSPPVGNIAQHMKATQCKVRSRDRNKVRICVEHIRVRQFPATSKQVALDSCATTSDFRSVLFIKKGVREIVVVQTCPPCGIQLQCGHTIPTL